MRFHVLGVPHTVTNKEYLSCAYTQKAFKFCKMMKARGHYVIHYGHEDSDPVCDEHVTVVTNDDFNRVYGTSDWKNDTSFKYDTNDEVYTKFYKNTIIEISKRKQKHDFLLPFWGLGVKPVCDAHQDMICIEPGIGYSSGCWTKYKVFESHALLHAYMGLESASWCNPKWYDVVIPNYFDTSNFEFSANKDNYFLFLGRVYSGKGLHIAIQMTEHIGAKLIVAGTGTLKNAGYTTIPDHVEEFGYANVENRKKLMSRARAVITASQFLEPFCGVHMEAFMSGTPVISTDWGIFTETNLQGITGFRCRTFNDFVCAARNIHKISPYHCREWASNFTLDSIAPRYEKFFKDVLNVHQHKGWYDTIEPMSHMYSYKYPNTSVDPRYIGAGVDITKGEISTCDENLDWVILNDTDDIEYWKRKVKHVTIKQTLGKNKHLLKYKDIHKGKKGLVVCNGPSAKDYDFSSLDEDTVVIGFNAIFMTELSKYLDYYFVNDYGNAGFKGFARSNPVELKEFQPKLKKFYGQRLVSHIDYTDGYEKFLFRDNVNLIKRDGCLIPDPDFLGEIDDNFTQPITTFGSVTFVGLQFLVWCGIKDIDIIGVDINTSLQVTGEDRGVPYVVIDHLLYWCKAFKHYENTDVVFRKSLKDLMKFPQTSKTITGRGTNLEFACDVLNINLKPGTTEYNMNKYELVNYLFRNNMDKIQSLLDIFVKHKCDKGGYDEWSHTYYKKYQELFEPIRHKKLRIFEMGIGTTSTEFLSNMSCQNTWFGYEHGASQRAWREYFTHPDTEILSGDIDPNVCDGITSFQVDQTNLEQTQKLFADLGTFDIIIDDGLHTQEAADSMFRTAYRYLRPQGYYIIEDIPGYKTNHPDLIEYWGDLKPNGRYDDNYLAIFRKGEIDDNKEKFDIGGGPTSLLLKTNTIKVAYYGETGWCMGRIHSSLRDKLRGEIDIDMYDWGNLEQSKKLWYGEWKKYDAIIGNTAIAYLPVEKNFMKEMPEELKKKLIPVMHHEYINHVHFTEVLLTTYNYNYCGITPSVVDIIKKNTGLCDVHLVPIGVNTDDFKKFKDIKCIETIGQVSIPNHNKCYKEVKRPEWLKQIADGAEIKYEYIHGKPCELHSKLYENIDMLVVTSVAEGVATSICEAAACGIPVISTKVGYAKQLRNIKTFDTVDEAVAIIKHFNEHSDELKEYSEKLMNEVRTEWNWDLVAHKYWKPAIQKVINKKNLPRLENIFKKHGCDKGDGSYHGHTYYKKYEELFENMRHKKLRIFEMGVGTNSDAIKSNMKFKKGYVPGASLRSWKEYFTHPDTEVFAGDIDPNVCDGITSFQVDQTDTQSLEKLFEKIGKFDIIIDDGLHTQHAAKTMLDIAFKYLNEGGYYIIEDLLPQDVIKHENLIEVWSEPKPCGCTYDDNRLIIIKKSE